MAKSSKAAGGGRQGAEQSTATAAPEAELPPAGSGDDVAAPFPEADDVGDSDYLWATVQIPLIEGEPAGYAQRRIELKLSTEQAATLARIAKALYGQPYEIDPTTGATIEDGRAIDSGGKVFLWLLNKIRAQELKGAAAEPAESTERP
ncbi:MAG: hypothetical protein JNK76_20530 [Planctomycetales bacterium]|nr:hypothetical protein [Planctomycetales bacterium]